MLAVLQGFGVVILVISVGYFLVRYGVLGEASQKTLSTVVYMVATPALLVDRLIHTDPRQVLGPNLVVIALSALIVGFVAFLLFKTQKWDTSSSIIGMLSSSYANGGNLGIPLAVYLLGDAAAVVPVILFQVAFYAPLTLTWLDIVTSEDGGKGWKHNIVIALKNPMLIAAVIGLIIALTGWNVPAIISEPISILSGAAVPLALMVFGMSMYGMKLKLTRGVSLSVGLKNIAMPIVAGLLAYFVFGMEGHALYTAVVIGALPTAQNVLTYALRFQTAGELARNTGVASTLVSFPVLIIVGVIFGSG